MKRFWVVLLALIFVLSLGLAGCNDATPPPVTPPSTEKGDGDGDGSDEDPPAPPEEEPMTFADLLETDKTAGKTFFTEHIRPAVTQAAVLAETVNFVAEEDDTELEQISYSYIYEAEGTARKYDVVNLTLPAPVSFDDIASGKAGDVTPSVQTVLSFGFDAKEFVDRAELCDALAYRIEKYTTIGTNASKYFGTVERTESGVDQILTYPVLFEDDNKFFVDSISIYDRNYEEAQLIENLYDQTKYDLMRCGSGFKEEFAPKELGGEMIFRTAYQAEFEKTHDPDPEPEPDAEKVGTIENLLTNYADEVNQGLKGAYEYMVKKIWPSNFAGFDQTKIIEARWDFVVDEHNNITKINYFGKYNTIGADYVLSIVSITLSSPFSISELTDQNIIETLENSTAENAATYKYEFGFGYNENSQSQYQELAEAVFEAEGLKEEGAEYYISWWGGGTDQTLGSVRDTAFMQVTSVGIQKISVRIQSSNDLVSKVKSGKYKATIYPFYSLGGHSIAAQDYAQDEE